MQKKFDENPEAYLSSKENTEDKKEEHTPSRAEAGPPAKKGEESRGDRIDLPVVGMSCASCASTIQRGLGDLKGVDKASVNFANSKATVLYDPQLVKP